MIGRILKFFFLNLLLSSYVLAQELSVNVEPNFGMTTDSFMFSISIKGEINKVTPPILGTSKEFIITSSGTSSRREIANGKVSNEVSFNYELAPRATLPAGDYKTPSGSININGTNVEIPSQKITIVDTPPEQKRKNDRIKINQFTDKEVVYIGEQITYTIQVISGADFLGGNLDDIQVLGFWREKLGDQEKKVFNAGSKTITTFQEVLIPNKSGEVEIPERTLHAQIEGPAKRVGLPSFFEENFFGGMSMITKSPLRRDFTTKPIKIQVKPLPPNSIKGYIPVGHLNIKSNIDRKTVQHGESINLKIRLSGFANLRPLEIEKPQNDNFKIYIDPAETNVSYEKARVRFTKIFNVILIPNVSGELELPEFKFTYFDPLAEQYKTLITEKTKIFAEGNFDNRVNDVPKETEDEKVEFNPELLSSKIQIDLAKSIKISVIFAALAFLVSIILFLKNKKADRNFESALELALNKIENGEELPAIFKIFLGKKLNKNLSSLTLKEIQNQILNSLLKDPAHSKKILEELDNNLYNPNKKLSPELKKEFISLIRELDHEL